MKIKTVGIFVTGFLLGTFVNNTSQQISSEKKQTRDFVKQYNMNRYINLLENNASTIEWKKAAGQIKDSIVIDSLSRKYDRVCGGPLKDSLSKVGNMIKKVK